MGLDEPLVEQQLRVVSHVFDGHLVSSRLKVDNCDARAHGLEPIDACPHVDRVSLPVYADARVLLHEDCRSTVFKVTAKIGSHGFHAVAKQHSLQPGGKFDD